MRLGPWLRPATNDPAPATNAECRRRAAFAFAIVLAFACGLLDDIALVWDEPFYFSKQYRLDQWYALALGNASARAEAFQRDQLLAAWNFCRSVPHENPPVYAILSHLTWRATKDLWSLVGDARSSELRGHRLAPAILFSAAASVLYTMAWRQWGTLPALATLGAWVLHPRVFAHGRLATTDMIMTGFWVLSAAALFHACEHRRRAFLFGPLWALSVMSKATGVLALPAQLLWSVLFRRDFARTVFLWAALLAPLAALLVHPAWWSDPIDGLRAAVNVHRHRHEIQKVKTYYLGSVYEHALPWHNTLVLTVACTPAAWTTLAALGLVYVARGGWRKSFVGWILINWATLMVVRATPFAPGHDGIRQFLAAFPFFALLAGLGVWSLGDWMSKRLRQASATRVTALIVFAACSTSFAGWLMVRPYELSFYSSLIGGLPGARRLGLETTYYWDAASWETLDYLNTLPADTTIGIPYELHTFTFYQRWGYLRPDLVFVQEHAGPRILPQYYLILAREGTLTERARERLEGPAMHAVVRQGVRLLALVDNRQR